jgi:predicted lactoylglutathione lyase
MFTDAIGVMLLTHEHYREFTKRADRRRATRQPGNVRPYGC